jgi:hypothetical protein
LLYLYAFVYSAMVITLERSKHVAGTQVTKDNLLLIVQFVDRILYKTRCINCNNTYFNSVIIRLI